MNVVFIFKIALDLPYQQPLASVSIANNALCQMDRNNGIRVIIPFAFKCFELRIW